ncbi:uncharacterized protein LOC110754724 isoform X2 [Prunus avium]|uniref:Uncharacterized protein LOC110754724 isoform X2 n=1 Tax=Prunus avium TaxID=42229 RepID=A0A6P5SAS7_PRUAV|nr:uncharacterized protein LOC110754724 isoform X2 [Prunus avium]
MPGYIFLSFIASVLSCDQELHGKERKLSYELYLKVLFISKVLTYLVLLWWFWRVPVASISQQLVQPFGKVLSWSAGGILNENVMG